MRPLSCDAMHDIQSTVTLDSAASALVAVTLIIPPGRLHGVCLSAPGTRPLACVVIDRREERQNEEAAEE
ncbi:hypothetical protein BaRGS_00032874 [Batillaria attramentaria]|uniref:Uncharacterized protein n=1 Tax=Batillaria attramentaria TaxID=370345 RepID=A0ABD0JMK2_9CAEN